MRRFLLKVNGETDMPDGICKPSSAAAWEGKDARLPLLGSAASYRIDGTPGPEIEAGDMLFIWTHEHPDFGHGQGMTATATAGAVDRQEDAILITLRDVHLIERPFGFARLGTRADASPFLQELHRKRRSRAWVVDDTDAEMLEGLIAEFDRPLSSPEAAAAEAAHLNDWDRALSGNKESILAAVAERKMALTPVRPGQQEFRRRAMERHRGRCVVTGCAVEETLEAAHVIPHTGEPMFERPDNSLILRRDIHALFDAFLISIHPPSGQLRVAERLRGTIYGKLLGREVRHQLADRPLDFHFRQFQDRAKSEGSG